MAPDALQQLIKICDDLQRVYYWVGFTFGLAVGALIAGIVASAVDLNRRKKEAMNEWYWVQQLVDYAEKTLRLSRSERNWLVERAYQTKPWRYYTSAIDWAAETLRSRIAEDK